MSAMVDPIVIGLMSLSMVFFVAGTLGLLRFRDTPSRLHALTKADNVGLGLLVAALALQSQDARVSLELLFIWLLVMVSGATACYLIASRIDAKSGSDEL
ncbi:MAG: multicomponent Na+:H+ antiporter subunit G [Gammaproteobacteria bacterium]|jgi:multicomponent Na+:H+ antiporter subunit G